MKTARMSIALAAAALAVAVVSAQQQPPPAAPASAAPQLQGVFRSGVELVRVDVQVVSGEGQSSRAR